MSGKTKEVKPGEPLSQRTVAVLSVVGGLFVISLIIGLTTEGGWPMTVVGSFLLLIGILCTLPNLIGFARGKKRERLIRQGKLVEPEKTYKSRFDD